MNRMPNKIKLVHPVLNMLNNMLCDYPLSEYVVTAKGACPTSSINEVADLHLVTYPRLRADGYVEFQLEVKVKWMKAVSGMCFCVRPIYVYGYVVKTQDPDDQLDWMIEERGPYKAGVWYKAKLSYKINLQGIEDPNFRHGG